MNKSTSTFTIWGLIIAVVSFLGYLLLKKKDTATNSDTTTPLTREAAIQNRIAEIKKDANYMEAVRKDAQKKGISINEALIQSATYSVDYLTGY